MLSLLKWRPPSVPLLSLLCSLLCLSVFCWPFVLLCCPVCPSSVPIRPFLLLPSVLPCPLAVHFVIHLGKGSCSLRMGFPCIRYSSCIHLVQGRQNVSQGLAPFCRAPIYNFSRKDGFSFKMEAFFFCTAPIYNFYREDVFSLSMEASFFVYNSYIQLI